MSSCCRAGPCEEIFDARSAAWDLRRYRRNGPGRLERSMLLLSFPRDTLLLRWLSRVQNALFRLLKRQFRFYVRPEHKIAASAEAQGLTLVQRERGPVWEYLAFRRE
jgi:hypothetical protein